MFNHLKFTLIFLLAFQLSGCGGVTAQESYEDNNTLTTTLNVDDFINNNNCDQILEKEFSTGSLLSLCYDYGYKASKYVAYTLDGTLVDAVNLDDRPSFYTEEDIPEEYQALYSDYTNSGYDRGHLAPDADFDYNEEDLYLVYTLANIIPQTPNVNRYFWTKVEAYERLIAYQLGELTVINGVEFENPDVIGNNHVAVPKGFWKMLWNNEENFKECYYYDNFVVDNAEVDTLALHRTDCTLLLNE